MHCSDGSGRLCTGLLPAHETERAAWRFNDSSFALRAGLCAHHLVAMQALRTPSPVALEWLGSTLTYAGVQGAAEAVALWLLAQGIAADQVVALQLRRSLEQVVGLLGVLQSVVLPASYEAWPAERRQSVLERMPVDILIV